MVMHECIGKNGLINNVAFEIVSQHGPWCFIGNMNYIVFILSKANLTQGYCRCHDILVVSYLVIP